MAGKSRVSREAHARFCERLGVKFPGATRPGAADDFGRKTMPEIARSVAFHAAIVTLGALS